MSLLTDALNKPDPPTDETTESAITELEEKLDISGELDESSRDPTVQTVALDELMLEEFEAARRLRETAEQPVWDEPAGEQPPIDPTATDVLSDEKILASQSIVLEELPEGTLDAEPEPLAILHEPPTLSDTEVEHDPTMVVMPDPETLVVKTRQRPVKLIVAALLVALAVGAVVLFFVAPPSDELSVGRNMQVEQSFEMQPATLSSLAPTAEEEPADVSMREKPTPTNVGPPVESRPSFARETATPADIRGFAAAAQRAAETEPDSQPTIEIARTRRENPIYLALTEAYAQFQRGDFGAAGLLYQEALELDPKNIDALLGLAAIAQRGSDLTRAQNFYRMALSLDPKNSIAIAGMMSLQQASATVENESELKSMLAEHPQAAHLHFALGLHYVSQSRWPDAQQSFFEAVRYDPANADYTFNLAVSLDQLGQRDAAASYYRAAIELAQGAQKFELDTARKRLSTLTASS